MRKNAMYIVVASSLMILFCLVYQGTFSYFAVEFRDDRTDKKANVSAANLQDLAIVNSSQNGSENLIPGENVNSTFTITNPSNVDLCFSLVWTDVVNTFVNKNDLEVTLKDSANNIITTSTFPSTDELLATGISISGNSTESYLLTVE